MPAIGSGTERITGGSSWWKGPLHQMLRVTAIAGIVLAGLVLLFAAGFLWFVTRIPDDEITLDRNADGIVVLTGGAARISDAIELLASGRGRRLLISGVHPTTNQSEISRLVPKHEKILACCVDLDRSAVNTVGNATETRRWVNDRGFRSLIVVTSNYHMPRALAELSHQLPGVALIAFPVVTHKPVLDSANARLLVSEYVKYIFAVVRMRVEPEAG
jgi:uncharacterized SAM-binding protein YcdF (DUF218 family)